METIIERTEFTRITVIGGDGRHHEAEMIDHDENPVWIAAVVLDPEWTGRRSVFVREESLAPQCECGNVFRLCHPEA